MSNHLRDNLTGIVTPAEFQEIAETFGAIDRLGPERVAKVRIVFAEGYRRQFQLLAGFSGAALLAALFLTSRHPVNVQDVARQREGVEANTSDSARPVVQAQEELPRTSQV